MTTPGWCMCPPEDHVHCMKHGGWAGMCCHCDCRPPTLDAATPTPPPTRESYPSCASLLVERENLTRALQAIAELHRPVSASGGRCRRCYVFTWPCPTRQVADAALSVVVTEGGE